MSNWYESDRDPESLEGAGAQGPPGEGSNLPAVIEPRIDELVRAHLASQPLAWEDDDAISLKQYLQVLRRRKWLLVSVVASAVFLAALQVFTTTPLYTATATLQIDPENQQVLPFAEVDSAQAWGYFMEEYLLTQADKLESARVARRARGMLPPEVLEELDRPISSGALTDAIGGLRATVTDLVISEADGPSGDDEPEAEPLLVPEVEPLRNTRLIRVRYTSADPQISALVANAVVEAFIEDHLESKYEATTHASEFLATKLEELQISVERSEEELLEYAHEHGIVNLSDRESITQKRLADLNNQLTEVGNEVLLWRSLSRSVSTLGDDPLPESLLTPVIAQVEERLSEVQGEIASLSTRFGPEWPQVRELMDEQADLEQQIARETARVKMSAASEYRFARARHAELERAVEEQRQLVDELAESSIQYNILNREVETSKEIYEGLLQRLKEAGIAAGLRSSNIRIANDAVPPESRSSPRFGRSLALALVLGLVLGVGIVFVAESLDTSLKGSDEVTGQLGLPALGMVPEMTDTRSKKGVFALASRRNGAEAVPILAFGRQDRQAARAEEAYRALRTSLLVSQAGYAPQVLLVTSALPGDGKSTTAANMAIALSQAGARTLLIDLDLRNPSLSEAFGIDSDNGMSTYLSGNSDLSGQIQPTQFDNLCLLPAGPRAPDPARLIGSARMAEGLELVREYFTHIVIDTPPTLEISDALVLSPLTDGIVLVVRGGRTPRKAIARAAEAFQRIGSSVLGVLVNAASMDTETYGSYGKYYSRYYDRYADSE